MRYKVSSILKVVLSFGSSLTFLVLPICIIDFSTNEY